MITVRNYIGLLFMFYGDVRKNEPKMYSSACYNYLVAKGKIPKYDSYKVKEIRKQVYNRLIEENSTILMKVKKENPEFFENNTIRMRAQSIVVNDYLRNFDSFEAVLKDLKLI